MNIQEAIRYEEEFVRTKEAAQSPEAMADRIRELEAKLLVAVSSLQWVRGRTNEPSRHMGTDIFTLTNNALRHLGEPIPDDASALAAIAKLQEVVK